MALLDKLDRNRALGFHSELALDNFSSIDTDVSFYTMVRAAYLRHRVKRVLDFGAGRNRYEHDFDPARDSFLIRDLRDLRYGGAEVTAADLSPEVRKHPTSDRQWVLAGDGKVPAPDGYFDLIVCDYVFEHVEQPLQVAAELERVLRPGGWIIARTPNKFGYLKIFASLVPNWLHNSVLRVVQPHRNAIDTFPTYYRLNSRSDVQASFRGSNVAAFHSSWEPAYFFGKAWLYRLLLVFHGLLPRALAVATVYMIQKRGDAANPAH